MEQSDKPKLSTKEVVGFYLLWIFGSVVLSFGFLILGILLIPDFIMGVLFLFFGGFALGMVIGFYVGKKLGIKMDTTFYGYR